MRSEAAGFRWGLTVVLVVGLGSAVMAQPPGEKKGKGAGQGPGRFQAMMEKLDVNGDRIIERGEVPEDGLAAFDRLLARGDTNKDGKLEGEELRGMVGRMTAAGGGGGGPGMLNRLKGMDKDSDGKLTRAEFTGPSQQFDRMDADKDGAIDEAEVKKAIEAQAQAMAAMSSRLDGMDKDKDGKLTREEYTGPEALFGRLDRNGDGSIDANERPGAGGRPGGRTRPAGAPGFEAMDADGDGSVSKAEFRGPEQLFQRLDKNQDGKLTSDERPKRQVRPASADAGPKGKRAAKVEAKAKAKGKKQAKGGPGRDA